MGTDIHVAAEVATYENGEHTGWEIVPGPVVNCWLCNGTGISDRGKPCFWCGDPRTEEIDDEDDGYLQYRMQKFVEPGKFRDNWYSDRNYRVFAALADVRNGRGFAGVYTHEPIKPIDYPRGLPPDVTDEALALLSNEHSQTWLGLDEVMAYDWDQTIHEGVDTVLLMEYAEGFLARMKMLMLTAGERRTRLVFDFDS